MRPERQRELVNHSRSGAPTTTIIVQPRPREGIGSLNRPFSRLISPSISPPNSVILGLCEPDVMGVGSTSWNPAEALYSGANHARLTSPLATRCTPRFTLASGDLS